MKWIFLILPFATDVMYFPPTSATIEIRRSITDVIDVLETRQAIALGDRKEAYSQAIADCRFLYNVWDLIDDVYRYDESTTRGRLFKLRVILGDDYGTRLPPILPYYIHKLLED